MATIRREVRGDESSIRTINELAFGRTAEADIVDALRSARNDCVSLVAVVERRIVGHVLFSPAVAIDPVGPVIGKGLAPLAVLPRWQRHGIGSALVRTGLGVLRTARCPFVVVLGDPAYYSRFGFQRASTHGITSQWQGVPDEAFMVLALSPHALAGISGIVSYRDEFDSAV